MRQVELSCGERKKKRNLLIYLIEVKVKQLTTNLTKSGEMVHLLYTGIVKCYNACKHYVAIDNGVKHN